MNVCLSGGATGADLAWGRAARAKGHRVIHFSFARHDTDAPADERRILDDAELRAADPHLAGAAKALGRPWPPRAGRNLLRRDWHQVKDSERVYAVASFRKDGQVEGGTAWAVALFLDRHHGRTCELYLFDQDRAQWLRWDRGWRPIDRPPVPRGRWTGIGTRNLNAAGRDAIRALLGAA